MLGAFNTERTGRIVHNRNTPNGPPAFDERSPSSSSLLLSSLELSDTTVYAPQVQALLGTLDWNSAQCTSLGSCARKDLAIKLFFNVSRTRVGESEWQFLGEWAVSYGRGTPVHENAAGSFLHVF